MRVLILAAGYGTRLYPMTLHTPKALLPVRGKPLLNHLLEKIQRLAMTMTIEKIIVVSNNKFYEHFLLWKKQHFYDEIEIVNDGSNSPEERRGAVGDIKFGISDYFDDWLVLGADNFFDLNLERFILFSQQHLPFPTVGVYDVKEKMIARELGVVTINKMNMIKRLEEKPQVPLSTLIATCIYFFPAASLEYVNEYLMIHKTPDMVGTYIDWLASRTTVYGYRLRGHWCDIGTKESLEKLELMLTK